MKADYNTVLKHINVSFVILGAKSQKNIRKWLWVYLTRALHNLAPH